jgi:hypothetical protein
VPNEPIAEHWPSNSSLQWVDENDVPPKDIQEKYSALGYKYKPTEYERKRPMPDNVIWYILLNDNQGAPTLDAVKSGNLEHMIESSKRFIIGEEW